jgi:hypothetical protein
MAHAVAAGIAGSMQEGMSGFVETFETALCYCLPEPERNWTLTVFEIGVEIASLAWRTHWRTDEKDLEIEPASHVLGVSRRLAVRRARPEE